MLEWNDNVLPVQISANVILVLSKTSVILSEAETCSNLEKNIIPHSLGSKYSLIQTLG